mmetsp:Transcript_25906/g.67979  ORF Transcript_25906/g.67979 Transcript_25906/m.67979 type:complete len:209 (+) Transcript_25906:256-882(+)
MMMHAEINKLHLAISHPNSNHTIVTSSKGRVCDGADPTICEKSVNAAPEILHGIVRSFLIDPHGAVLTPRHQVSLRQKGQCIHPSLVILWDSLDFLAIVSAENDYKLVTATRGNAPIISRSVRNAEYGLLVNVLVPYRFFKIINTYHENATGFGPADKERAVIRKCGTVNGTSTSAFVTCWWRQCYLCTRNLADFRVVTTRQLSNELL